MWSQIKLPIIENGKNVGSKDPVLSWVLQLYGTNQFYFTIIRVSFGYNYTRMCQFTASLLFYRLLWLEVCGSRSRLTIQVVKCGFISVPVVKIGLSWKKNLFYEKPSFDFDLFQLILHRV